MKKSRLAKKEKNNKNRLISFKDVVLVGLLGAAVGYYEANKTPDSESAVVQNVETHEEALQPLQPIVAESMPKFAGQMQAAHVYTNTINRDISTEVVEGIFGDMLSSSKQEFPQWTPELSEWTPELPRQTTRCADIVLPQWTPEAERTAGREIMLMIR